MGQPITYTTENALNAIAQSIDVSAYEGLFSTVQFYTGFDNEEKKGPCVICAAMDATEELPGSNLGVWNVKAQIIVKEQAKKANRETTTLADTIYRGFLTGSIENDLTNAVSNYKVHKVWTEGINGSIDGKFWVETLSLNVMCGLTQ